MSTAHETTIIINGRSKTVTERELSFEQLVALAFPDSSTGPNMVYTVTFRRGHSNQEGSLLPGKTVEVHEGMIFNVTATNRS